VDLVPSSRFGGIRPAIERLDPHPPHHRRDPLAADRDALPTQQIAQHPTARERVVEVQFVDPPHDRKIGRGHRAWLVIEAAAAEPQNFRLPPQRQSMTAVDHRFALSMPALPSAPAKKSFSSVSSPIFASSVFRSTDGAASLAADPEPNTPGGTLHQLRLPGRDLVRVNVNSCASSASVLSPLMAASATFA